MIDHRDLDGEGEEGQKVDFKLEVGVQVTVLSVREKGLEALEEVSSLQ